MHRCTRFSRYLPLPLSLSLAFACALPAHAQPYAATVLATGLNAPRGLSFAPDGALYIAEAGVPGGSGPSTVVRGATLTYVETGSITRWAGGATARVTTGLPTLWSSNGNQMEAGPNDIVFSPNGASFVAIGGGINPQLRSTALAPGGAGLQQLQTPGGLVDLGAHEVANNPAGGALDSNPWRVALSGATALVTDPGANALLSIATDGSVSTVATFGSRTVGTTTFESVPTGLAVAPGGGVYVGELTGFPFLPGQARIYTVGAGGALGTFASGFTMLVDLNVAPDGTLYALEYDSDGLLNPGTTGALWRVAADGSRSLVFSEGLVQPTAFAIGADGAFYVSNYGNTVGAGQLLRIAPVPEPAAGWLMALGAAALLVAMGGRGRRRARAQPPCCAALP